MDIKGKKILVTGACGGIGQALVKALDSAGANLILTARELDKLNEMSRLLDNNIHKVFAADLMEKKGRDALIAFAKSEQIDGMVNLAGLNDFSLLEDTAPTTMNSLVEMNLMVPMILCRELAPVLSAKPESIIVNVGSILGSIGYVGSSVYCATKFGLRGFSESLRREYADRNLKIVYVAPRATKTDMNSSYADAMNKDLGAAIDSPETVAIQILKAVTNQSVIHYIGWPENVFVRLNAIFPLLVDRFLYKHLSTIKRYARKKMQSQIRSAS